MLQSVAWPGAAIRLSRGVGAAGFAWLWLSGTTTSLYAGDQMVVPRVWR